MSYNNIRTLAVTLFSDKLINLFNLNSGQVGVLYSGIGEIIDISCGYIEKLNFHEWLDNYNGYFPGFNYLKFVVPFIVLIYFSYCLYIKRLHSFTLTDPNDVYIFLKYLEKHSGNIYNLSNTTSLNHQYNNYKVLVFTGNYDKNCITFKDPYTGMKLKISMVTTEHKSPVPISGSDSKESTSNKQSSKTNDHKQYDITLTFTILKQGQYDGINCLSTGGYMASIRKWFYEGQISRDTFDELEEHYHITDNDMYSVLKSSSVTITDIVYKIPSLTIIDSYCQGLSYYLIYYQSKNMDIQVNTYTDDNFYFIMTSDYSFRAKHLKHIELLKDQIYQSFNFGGKLSKVPYIGIDLRKEAIKYLKITMNGTTVDPFKYFFYDKKQRLIDYCTKNYGINQTNVILEGKPGSGKTSFINRLAQYLDLPIQKIDAAAITSKADLYRSFSINIPVIANVKLDRGIIFMLDEFDICVRKMLENTQALEKCRNNIYMKYHSSSSNNNQKNENENENSSMRGSSTLSANDLTQELQSLGKNPTIHDLLDIFSGVHENPDRIIVATTNNIEFITKALPSLTRSRRLTPFHFPEGDYNLFVNIVESYFSQKFRSKILDCVNYDFKFTQSDILEFLDTLKNSYIRDSGFIKSENRDIQLIEILSAKYSTKIDSEEYVTNFCNFITTYTYEAVSWNDTSKVV